MALLAEAGDVEGAALFVSSLRQQLHVTPALFDLSQNHFRRFGVGTVGQDSRLKALGPSVLALRLQVVRPKVQNVVVVDADERLAFSEAMEPGYSFFPDLI